MVKRIMADSKYYFNLKQQIFEKKKSGAGAATASGAPPDVQKPMEFADLRH